ncbi:MAG: hypothetical protein AB8B74_01650 [Crocinitomicaceae bacterium]
MDRKKFLATSVLTAVGLSTFGCAIQNTSGNFEGDCETTNDILGPFYRPKAPFINDLTFKGLKGARIKLNGIVHQADCKTPLKNALVEIWHCDSEGNYDNESDQFLHRASSKTKEDGKYDFLTILPGKYLNGKLYRPAHIHYRVTAPGFKELISQIYFKGDPHITEDPWASQSKADLRILPLIPENIKGELSVNFDIYLTEK